MYFTLSSAICLDLDQSKILSAGNGLTLSQTTIFFFPLFKTESVTEYNFRFDENCKVPQTGRKHCGKRRNCFVT